jgi:hypothetical protein
MYTGEGASNANICAQLWEEAFHTKVSEIQRQPGVTMSDSSGDNSALATGMRDASDRTR